MLTTLLMRAVRLAVSSFSFAVAMVIALTMAFPHSVWAVAGDLDTTFDGDGTVTLTTPSTAEYVEAVATQSDDKIVVVGGGPTDSVAWRIATDGTLDPTFGSGGKVTFSGFIDVGLIRFTTDRIFLIGYSDVTKLDMSGTVDATYGSSGVATFTLDFNVVDAAVDSLGRVVLVGCRSVFGSEGAYGELALARLDAAGSLDATFGTGGIVTTKVNGTHSSECAEAVLIQPGDKIVVAGSSFASEGDGDGSVVVLRYASNGTLDPTFDVDGKAIVLPRHFDLDPFGLFTTSDSKLVVVGRSLDFIASSDEDALNVEIVRLNANGALDIGLNGTGSVDSQFPYDFSLEYAVAQSDGKAIFVGPVDPSNDYTLVRFGADGQRDLTFSHDALTTTGPSLTHVTIDSKNRLILASSVDDDGGFAHPVITRLQADCVVNGILEPGEECDDGGSSSFCSTACELSPCVTASLCGPGTCYTPKPASDPCDDNSVCTTADHCDGAGACVAGTPQPFASCVVAEKSEFKWKQSIIDRKDGFGWKWTDEPITDAWTFGDPLLKDIGYKLCVFDGSGSLLQASVPAGGLCGKKRCWKTDGYHEKYTYADRSLAHDGILKAALFEDLGKFQLKGKGVNLPDPTGALADPVTVQLIKTDGSGCFSSTYTGAQIKRSDATSFKAKISP